MLVPILAVLGGIVLLVLLAAAYRPADFRYVRSITISASAEAIFGRVNDLRRFQEWSPWAKLDPAMKQTYSGPAAGVDAATAWEGNHKVGAGSMTIIESNAGQLIRMRLEFRRPFKATNIAEFTFRPAAGGTLEEWAMTDRYNFGTKLFSLFVNLDKMIGRDFEKGLAQLKGLAEGT